MKTSFFHTENGHIKFQSKSALRKYKTCERKTGLSNLAVNEILKKAWKKNEKMYSYLCPYCRKWHLTHIKQ